MAYDMQLHRSMIIRSAWPIAPNFSQLPLLNYEMYVYKYSLLYIMPKKKRKNSTKKERARKRKELEIQQMIEFLENTWNTQVHYTCLECLKTAYESVKQNKNGYITDEELMKASCHTLKYK
jgi:hypothetical protein